MSKNAHTPQRNILAQFCLLVLGALLLLAACGGSSNTTNSSKTSTAATNTPTGITGNATSTPSPTATTAQSTPTPTATTALPTPTPTTPPQPTPTPTPIPPKPTPTPTPPPITVVVQIITLKNGTFAFSPSSVTIPRGSTVIWKNNTKAPHTVTSDNGKFGSGTINPGGTYSFTFSGSGTYGYHCNFHPYMTAAIIVQ